MSIEYSRSVLRMVVAQICQTIGWHSINSTPLEFMVDLMQEYILRTSKLTHQYAEILGRTEANLDDLGLTFQHMNIDVQDLADYVKNVDSVACPVTVPKFPIRRDNHLNFLKPGSREVVTRPVHIHEHLPAMYPDTEEEYVAEKGETVVTNGTSDISSSNGASTNGSMNVSPHRMSPQVVFKRPGDPVSFESPIVKRVKVLEEGRPLREIHSVMMTTSGFLSPAREGKLPEARTPHQTRSDSPQSSSYPMVPPELKYDKKPKKIVKKPEDRKLDKENKKKNRGKELFKPDKVVDDSKVKKLAGMKELSKLKALKPGGGKAQCSNVPGPSSRPSTPKLMSPKTTSSPKFSKVNFQPKAKEKLIDLTGSPPIERKEDNNVVDKLPSEPDRQKLNIFKKISKPREDKDKETPENKHKELDSRESSPGLIIDENTEKKEPRSGNNDVEVKREEKKTPHTPDVHLQPDGDLLELQSPASDVYMFDDMSPPGTPSTPKTPELNVPTPTDQKRKKKEKTNRKKEPKSRSPKHCVSPKKTKLPIETVEPDIPDRPKTPQAPEPPLPREPNLPPTLPFPFFPTFPPAPGLIPHPMFPRFPMPLGRGAPHPAMPNLPLPPRFLNPKSEDFSLKKLEKSVPPAVEVIPVKHEKEKDRGDKKMMKQEKEIPQIPVVAPPLPSSAPVAPIYSAPLPIVPLLPKPSKLEKVDKNDKKSKEHKKEKKDKLKKKKDKKEKHKEKGEKVKDKKDKAEKKEKIEKIKEKKEKKDKRKEKEKEDKNAEAVPKITLRLGTASPRPPTPDNTPMKKITIKTLLKKPEEETKREPSPELAKISALVTRPPKQKSAKTKADAAPKKDDAKEEKENGRIVLPSTTTTTVDQGGRQVWICPACGNQDDGSPMVGCDDCDAWYHWVCVGMQVPPADNEDWYCRSCIAKKQELHHDKKKKKRKKKVKVPA